LIIQGTADTNVTPALQERFVAAYGAAGGVVQLEIFAGQPHVFPSQPGPDTDRALAMMSEFAARQIDILAGRG
jgi:dipeptidyl aminopeptidase/acylaminoacyl peptidase